MADYKHTILCVDDEQNILNSLRRLLRKEGYQLFTTSSGAEGLKLLEQNEVHVVICDQRMPNMSGTDFLARVKAQYPDTIRISDRNFKILKVYSSGPSTHVATW